MNFRFSIMTLALTTLVACGQTPAANNQTAASTNTAKHNNPAQIAKEVPPKIAQTIINTLEKNYADQQLKIQSVSTTPVAGLYEIVANGKQIAYTDETGNYMFIGDLIETSQGRSLTEERKTILNAIDYKALPFNQAIKEVRGNGKLQVAVFSDPDCPFCKRLEHEFAQMTNITIYNFMMPIASLHPDAAREAVQIMCQSNPTKAWTECMRENKMPPKVADCANPVAQTTALGENFGFNGTPTMVFPNGKVQSGYAPMPQLQEIIQANQ